MSEKYIPLVDAFLGATGVWIVEEPNQGWIRALSPCCRAEIHHNDVWHCSYCKDELTKQPKVRTSIININSSEEYIRTWISSWLDISVDQIEVTR